MKQDSPHSVTDLPDLRSQVATHRRIYVYPKWLSLCALPFQIDPRARHLVFMARDTGILPYEEPVSGEWEVRLFPLICAHKRAWAKHVWRTVAVVSVLRTFIYPYGSLFGKDRACAPIWTEYDVSMMSAMKCSPGCE